MDIRKRAEAMLEAGPLSGPISDFDDRGFFEHEFGDQAVYALLLVGGPPPQLSRWEESRQVPIVVEGPSAKKVVRAMIMEGFDRSLDAAIQDVIGWQPAFDQKATQRAIESGHPLIALDALRIAIGGAVARGEAQSAAMLARWLLLPSQARTIKGEAKGLLSLRLISQSDFSDPKVIALWEVFLASWEAEAREEMAKDYAASYQAIAQRRRLPVRLRQQGDLLLKRLK
jgi:hypothetical protein